MIYVALLRGINVGGRNKVDMKTLKTCFEKAGMTKVVTYINTGNIIFSTSDNSKPAIVNILEKAIHEDFNLDIKVVVRSLDDYQKVMKALPENWSNDKEMKSDVMFLWEEVDSEVILQQLEIKSVDTVIYVPGTVLWSVLRDDAGKSGMQKLAGSKVYKLMTVRNVNTTRKIWELMKES